MGQGVVGKKTLQRSMLRTGQQISPDSVGNHNTADCVRKVTMAPVWLAG
ncbi:hypothetical protein [Escherichia coli IS1]|nr:hypothetical protein [Escherichia coli IS1]